VFERCAVRGGGSVIDNVYVHSSIIRLRSVAFILILQPGDATLIDDPMRGLPKAIDYLPDSDQSCHECRVGAAKVSPTNTGDMSRTDRLTRLCRVESEIRLRMCRSDCWTVDIPLYFGCVRSIRKGSDGSASSDMVYGTAGAFTALKL
jgi:hypothetical protein